MCLLITIFLVINSFKNNQPRELQWQPDGSWLIGQKSQQIKAKLQAGSVVTPYFSSLNFKLENNRTLNVILFKDNVDAEKYRQLRVRMKVEGIH